MRWNKMRIWQSKRPKGKRGRKRESENENETVAGWTDRQIDK